MKLKSRIAKKNFGEKVSKGLQKYYRKNAGRKPKKTKRVHDMAPEDQTDEVKYDLYKMILPFVRKYQKLYYPAYKGEIEDLASDYFIEFMTPKARRDGKEETLLDKFDPEKTTLSYLVKVSVIRKLIDDARTDKGEINYSESYDEETGEPTLDFLEGLTQEEVQQIEEMEFDPEFVDTLVKHYNELPAAKKKEFLNYYNEVKNVIAPNFQELFNQAGVGQPEYEGAKITVSGTAPNFVATIKSKKGTEEVNIRARHIESAVRKLESAYPGATVTEDAPIADSCKKFFSEAFIKRING